MRSTAAASPRASSAGCTRAQSGSNRPPSAPATPIRDEISAGSIQRAWSSPKPHDRSRARPSRSPAAWPGVRATTIAPPFTKPASIPSRSSVSPITSTVRRQATFIAIARSRSLSAA